MEFADLPLSKRLNWANIVFFTLTPIAALVMTWEYARHHSIGWFDFAALVVTWFLTQVSITAGYHRLMSHRSYEVRPLVKLFFLIVGSAAFQGSALVWCSDHRRHHRFTDRDGDPHNINEGFLWAHLGWMLLKEDPKTKNVFPHDLKNDRWIAWQHRNYTWLAITTAFLVPLAIGWLVGDPWGGLIFAGVLRLVVVHHNTFFINSLAHTVGARPYSDTQTARDSLLMAVLACGEGYHNFHHQFQADYRNGIRWYHWDPTKWVIEGLASVGLAYKLKAVPQTEILKARLRADHSRLLRYGVPEERIHALKQKVEEAQRRWRGLCDDYRRLKRNMTQSSREHLLHLKMELKMARLEFKMAWAQWGVVRRRARALAAAR